MSYNTLKALVNSKVYENTEQRITGGDMNDVLQSAIASLGAHYQFGGLVSPTDQITVGDEPVVFLATTPGTYTYFGSRVVADGEVALLVWSGTAWSKQTPDIATGTEVNQLGQEINGLVSNNYTEGYYINSSGVLAESSAWGASDFIEYESGNDVIWTFGGGQFGMACIVFYDSSKTPFADGHWGAPNGGSKTISASDIARYAPNAAYLRVSFRLAYIEEANVKVADEVVWEPENIQIDGLVKECVKGWILSEAYTVSSLTRDSDGNVSTANVVWPDMKTGTLIITRNSEGNATSMSATHDDVTYTLTITRNSEGDVTKTSVSVS